MERFTDRFSDGTAFIPEHIKQRFGMQEVIDRLAWYEDTGLTQGQIVEIDHLYREKCEELARLDGFALVSENDRLRRRNAALEIQVKKLEAELKAKENS